MDKFVTLGFISTGTFLWEWKNYSPNWACLWNEWIYEANQLWWDWGMHDKRQWMNLQPNRVPSRSCMIHGGSTNQNIFYRWQKYCYCEIGELSNVMYFWMDHLFYFDFLQGHFLNVLVLYKHKPKQAGRGKRGWWFDMTIIYSTWIDICVSSCVFVENICSTIRPITLPIPLKERLAIFTINCSLSNRKTIVFLFNCIFELWLNRLEILFLLDLTKLQRFVERGEKVILFE